MIDISLTSTKPHPCAKKEEEKRRRDAKNSSINEAAEKINVDVNLEAMRSESGNVLQNRPHERETKMCRAGKTLIPQIKNFKSEHVLLD